MNRLLVAVLARMFPGRGRHQHAPGPDETVILPRVPPWCGQDDTRSDIPPFKVRPYMQPGSEDGPGHRGFLP